jgi:hypothetical protein
LGRDLPVEVRKLGVAIRVGAAFERLAVGLQAVAQLPQQLGDQLMADPMPPRPQLGRQLAHALAGPAQRGLRITARGRLDQPLQIRPQRRVGVHRPLPASAGPSHPLRGRPHGGRRAQLGQPRLDRAARDPGHAGDTRHPAPAQRQRFGGSHQAPPPLIQQRRQHGKPLPHGL